MPLRGARRGTGSASHCVWMHDGGSSMSVSSMRLSSDSDNIKPASSQTPRDRPGDFPAGSAGPETSLQKYAPRLGGSTTFPEIEAPIVVKQPCLHGV